MSVKLQTRFTHILLDPILDLTANKMDYRICLIYFTLEKKYIFGLGLLTLEDALFLN